MAGERPDSGKGKGMRKTKKGILLSMSLFMALSLFVACGNAEETEAPDVTPLSQLTELKISEDERQDWYMELQKTSFDLRDSMGEENLYPYLYFSAATRIVIDGMSVEDSIDKTAQDYILSQAIVCEAAEKGITVSDQEMDDHIQELIAEAEKADNYEEMSASCEKAGITVADLYKRNQRFYKEARLKSILYKQWLMKFYQEQDPNDEEFKGSDEVWKEYTEDIVKRYKRSRAYRDLQAELKETKKQLNK